MLAWHSAQAAPFRYPGGASTAEDSLGAVSCDWAAEAKMREAMKPRQRKVPRGFVTDMPSVVLESGFFATGIPCLTLCGIRTPSTRLDAWRSIKLLSRWLSAKNSYGARSSAATLSARAWSARACSAIRVSFCSSAAVSFAFRPCMAASETPSASIVVM